MIETLQGKVVMITGAAGGIGSASAEAFSQQGAKLALLDNNASGLQKLAEHFRENGVQVSTATVDLTDKQKNEDSIHEVLLPFDGQIDILHSNVGVVLNAPFEETSLDQWEKIFAINVFSHVATIKAILPSMKQRGGAIIFTGSDQGLQPDAGLSLYASTKVALHTMTKTLARELAAYSIRVNAVAPGMTRTPLVDALMEGYAQEFGTDRKTAEQLELKRRGVPMGRLAETEEVAQAVVYLAQASYCTATILNISGGNVRGMTS